MSRRAVGLVIVFLAVLVIANIAVIVFWLPRNKTSAAPVTPASSVVAQNSAVVSRSATPVATGSAATSPAASADAAFAVERQVKSDSGNLLVKYLRDRRTKTRRITVETPQRPGDSFVLLESKNSVWALVSPDDQWMAVEERKTNGEGNVQLFHRNNNASAQFSRVDEGTGRGIQEAVWNTYVNATQADPANARRGAAINPTAWTSDSQKLNLSVVYMPGPNDPDVPAPWSCTYNVNSKQVDPVSAPESEPESDQTAENTDGQNPSSAETSSSSSFAEDASEETGEENVADELPGERFPATRLEELTVPDVNESSLEEITYAMNEMYARHGAEFNDKKVAGQFSGFEWYKPRSGLSLASAEGEFTDLEKANMKVLRTCRDAKSATTRRQPRQAQKPRHEEEGAGEKAARAFRLWQEAGAPMPHHP